MVVIIKPKGQKVYPEPYSRRHHGVTLLGEKDDLRYLQKH